MKIAIHHTPGSFSDRWIAYCEKQGIPYKIVNAYASDIMEQVKDCDAFMWHHNHGNYKDALFAKQLLYSLQIAGKRVFPDFNTTWHFDDKVGQKYLLEAIGGPLVPSYVFYSKREALEWAKQTSFPKVFKLRGGGGSANVRLVRTRSEAYRVIRKAFTSGFSQFNRWRHFKERFNRWRRGDDTLWGVCKGIGRLLIPTEFARMHPKEKGYVYFQDFIPDMLTDFRIKVVNGRCWGFQRRVREHDFRASGSGDLIFDSHAIPLEVVQMAQAISRKLLLQSVAFDFLRDQEGKWWVIEMSYGFGFDEREMSYGYWDEHLMWHDERFIPQEWMVESVCRR